MFSGLEGLRGRVWSARVLGYFEGKEAANGSLVIF